VRGEVAFDFEVENQRAKVAIVGGYQSQDRRLDLKIDFSPIVPAVFARLSPALRGLADLDLPVEGTATVGMTVDGTVDRVGFDLSGGAGRITLPAPLAQTQPVDKLAVKGRFEGGGTLRVDTLAVDFGRTGSLYLPAPTNHRMPLRSLSAKGVYDIGGGKLNVSRLALDLQGPRITLAGSVKGIGGTMSIAAKGMLHNLRVDDFTRYWPRAWGRDAQEWCVAHLFDGAVPEVRAEIALKGDPKKGFRIETLRGDMDITGVTVDYLPPMPMAERVWARAEFDRTRFDIFVSRGEAAGLTIGKGTLRVSGLDKVDQVMDVDLAIDGPLKNALRLIDYRPLNFAKALGIDSARAGGTASARLRVKFPIEHGLRPDQVQVSATAALSRVALADAVFGRPIRDGRLDLKVDNRRMDVAGNVHVGTIPAHLAWRENFGRKVPYRSRIRLKGRLDDAQRTKELGLSFAPFSRDFMTGEVGADVQYTELDGAKGTVTATLDLTDAALALPDLGWTKAAGAPGTATVDLSLVNERPRAMPRFKVKAGDLAATGSAVFDKKDGSLTRLDFDRLAYGRTDVVAALIPGGDGGWTATMHGPAFDMEPLLNDLTSGPSETEEKAGRPGPRISLSVDLDRVWLAAERGGTRVAGSLVRDGDTWRNIRLDGVAGKGKAFHIQLVPAASKRNLRIRAADAGALLHAFKFYDNMVGGTLDLNGQFDDTKDGSPLKGKVVIRNYRVIRAPALAHVLSIMALTGILDALKGEGLAFSVLEAPFTLRGGVLKVTDARATGNSLGFTAAGTIYTDFDSVEIKGTVVPAYVINSVLGKIPVLGKLLTGGEKGGGVFAANYTMTGPMNDLKVSVNPLSALAPGFLRNIFGVFEKKLEGAPAPPEKAEEPKKPRQAK